MGYARGTWGPVKTLGKVIATKLGIARRAAIRGLKGSDRMAWTIAKGSLKTAGRAAASAAKNGAKIAIKIILRSGL